LVCLTYRYFVFSTQRPAFFALVRWDDRVQVHGDAQQAEIQLEPTAIRRDWLTQDGPPSVIGCMVPPNGLGGKRFLRTFVE
jgi:hypothetical protein